MFALWFFHLRTLCLLPFLLVWSGSSCFCVEGFSSGVMGLEYNYGCLVPRASGWPVFGVVCWLVPCSAPGMFSATYYSNFGLQYVHLDKLCVTLFVLMP